MKPVRWSIVPGILLLLTLSVQADGTRGVRLRQMLSADVSIPEYHALIIGINKYAHWQDLRQARPDAEEVAALLSSRYGFTSVANLYDEQATRAGMILALRRLATSLTENDALLIFYAGHGYFDDLMKRGYWVPYEAREKIDGQPATMDWLSNTDLQDFIGMTRARHVLVVSDSCFSGSLFRGGTPDLTTKEHTWYRRAIAQPSRWAISSGDLEQVPDDSAFARKFVSALQYPLEPVFSASDLAGRIKVEVAGDSGAQPLFGRLQLDRDSPFGEFVFLDRGHDTAAAAAAPARPTPQPPPPAPVASRLQPAPVPTAVRRTGTLIVLTPRDGHVSLNGGNLFPISATQGLRWPDLSAGEHVVKVVAGGLIWQDTVSVPPDRETTVMSFPEEQVRQQQARQAADQAAALEAERQRLQLLDEIIRRQVEAEKKTVEEEAPKKRHRPRVF